MAVPHEALKNLYAQIEPTWTERMASLLMVGEEIVTRDNLAETPVGKAVCSYGLSVAMLLRPLLRDPVASRELFQTIGGGPDYNPHYAIDLLPGALGMIMWRSSPISKHLLLWLEESGFNSFSRNRKNLLAITDPLDGSKTAELGLRDQVSGVVVYNKNGLFVAGAITSLVHNTIMFAETDLLDARAKLINFNEIQGQATEFYSNCRETESHDPLRYQTLPRRIATLQNTILYENHGYPQLSTLGGYGILMMAEGKQDVMIDLKGQPTPEACIWYTMAQEFGFPVVYPDGQPVDISSITLNFWRTKQESRVPVVIGRTPEVLHQVLPLLQRRPEEVLVVQN